MNISEDKLQVIDMLIAKFPKIVFGGSIALNALGLINREVGDIDVFYPDKQEYKNWLISQQIDDTEYENDVDMLGFITHRIGVKIGNVKVCGFEIPKGKETESTVCIVEGRAIHVQNPIYAIIAKGIYADKTQKHAKDLSEIQTNLYRLINFYGQYSV